MTTPTSEAAPVAAAPVAPAETALGSTPVEAAKPAESTKPVEAAPVAKTEAAPAAPAPIELKLPDGLKLPETELAAAKKLFTDAGLDGEKSQKLFDGYLAMDKARVAEAEKSYEAQNSKWVDAIKSDPDVGGEKFAASKQAIERGVKHFGPVVDEARVLLNRAGLGNNPTMFKLFVALGRSVKEDTVAGTGSAAPDAPLSYERAAYPTMYEKKES